MRGSLVRESLRLSQQEDDAFNRAVHPQQHLRVSGDESYRYKEEAGQAPHDEA